MGLFRFKIRKYFRSQEDFFGKSLLLYMVIYGIIYKAIYFPIYIFWNKYPFLYLLFQKLVFFWNKAIFFFQFILWWVFLLKFIGAKTLPLPLPLPSSQGIKKGEYSWYSIPEFIVISFTDSVAVFDSLSDCSFLCQYWYFC